MGTLNRNSVESGGGVLSVGSALRLELVLFAKDGGTSYLRIISLPSSTRLEDFKDGMLILRDCSTGLSKQFAKIVINRKAKRKTAKGEKVGN